MKTSHRFALSLWFLTLGLPASFAAAPSPGSTLKVLTQSAYLPQSPVLVRVEVRKPSGERDRDLWDAEATLTAEPPSVTLSTNKVTLRNGMGSALVVFSGGGNFTLTATVGNLATNRSLQDVSASPVTSPSGTLAGSSTTWSNVIRITNDVTVPVGHTLTIQSNTLVTINGVASGTVAPDLIVNGTINSLGTEQHPVTITCATATLRWGQIRHNSAQPSLYRHTSITRAGRAPGEGHTGQAPVIRPNNSTITFESCNITDHADASGTPGKLMYAIDSDLTFNDCLLGRARMGPEIQGTALLCTNTWLMDMKGPDDSDGIYLHDQQVGQQLRLAGCVLANGDDDGIDTLGATMTVSDCIIRDWINPSEDAKGISAFHGAVDVSRSIVANCYVGISAKSGGPLSLVRIENTTVTALTTGLYAAFKANATVGYIDFRVTNTIVRATDAIATDFGPTNFSIGYCNLSEVWPGTGNITGDPRFINSAEYDFHLRGNSPCINSGNPASPLDPDGTRADMGVFPFRSGVSNTFIAFGSGWKYLDDGSNQGTAWTGLGFNDTGWSNGLAELGYGDLDEVTTVRSNRLDQTKIITTYFRHAFNVTDASAYTSLSLRLLRDDGGVVYLNTNEIFRSPNMPPGNIAFDTVTLGSVENEIDVAMVTNALPFLLTGTNVMAVEIHQQSTGSSDISFNFEFTGITGTSGEVINTSPSVAITSPANGAGFGEPADITLNADASDNGSVTQVEFFQNGQPLGADATAAYSLTWNGVGVGSYTFTAVATDNTGLRGTSAPVNITVSVSSGIETNVLVAAGSTWRYLDNGSDQGTNWSQRAYDDSSWSNGVAALGYPFGGGGAGYPIITVVGYGPDAGNKYTNTYFRARFYVEEPERVQQLWLETLYDDGAVVHINGEEVFRTNMPFGPITSLTLASSAGNYIWDRNVLLPTNAIAALVSGTNILAVEMHQGSPNSSDIVMDAALRAVVLLGNQRPTVNLTSPANNTIFGTPANITLGASASDDSAVTNVAFYANGGKLADDPNSPYSFPWNNVPAGTYALTAVASDDTGLSRTSAVVNITVSTNTAPPVVTAKSPPPGTVTNLTQINVTFSKAVIGVDASDLLVNGVSATGVSGSGSNYTFTFSQPAYGTVSITWAVSHGITDVFTPPNAFDRNGAGATWQYQFNDAAPPVVTGLDPVPGSTMAALTSISLTFSEAVVGVNASDLLINSAPASTLTGSGAGPYAFGFAQPAQGVVQAGWATGHGIRDTTSNAFGGGSWSYELNTNATGIIISEIMYHPSSENVLEEYIELYNKGASGVSLTGWRFTGGVQFIFPSVSIPAGGYLVVAANVATFTNKYPGVTNVVGNWTGFLNNSSEDIDLDDASVNRADSVRYADEGDWAIRRRGVLDRNHRGWDWFAGHDGLGRSLELINPNLSNNSGQNWGSSLVTNGTPGSVNSLLANNVAPFILEARHFPVVPRSTDPLLFTVRIADETAGSVGVTLQHRVSSAAPPAFTTNVMRDDGLSGDATAGDGIFSAQLPAQTNNAVVEFYVRATDFQGNIRTWPAPAMAAADGGGPTGQVANALFQVDDTIYNPTNNQPLYKLIMTEIERAELAGIPPANPDRDSNAQMNGTFVSLDTSGPELHYLCGFRNRGHGSRGANPPNYRIAFRSDDKWKGVTALNLNSVNVIIQHMGSVAARKAGAVGADTIPVQLRVNNVNRASGSYAAVEVLNGDWGENHFPFDPNGNIYRIVRDFAPLFDYRGENPVSYQTTWFKESNQSENDWTDLIGMLRVAGINNLTSFTTENVRQVINVEQWLRHLAVMNIFGNNETGLNTGYNDDYYMYRGVNDPRFMLSYHDLDSILGVNSRPSNDGIFTATFSNGSGQAMDRLMHWPDFEPIYFRILSDLMNTTFSQANFDALVDQTLGDYVDNGTISSIKSWMNQRRTSILSQLPPITNADPPVATLSGVPRSPTPLTGATLTVGGAGITSYQVALNGGAFGSETPVATPISLSGLANGTNLVAVIGKDTNDVWQATENATVRSWVVNTSVPAVRLNEVLARNESAVNHHGTFPDVIELFNEGSTNVDLSGLRLTDDPGSPGKFTFPNPTMLAAGAYLLVYANDPDGTPGLHLGFNLDADGEGVYLFSRATNGNVVLDSVVFGRQLSNLSIGRLGGGGDWLLTQPTFSGANSVQPLGNPRNLKLNEWLASGANPYPEDFIELYNPNALPVALGGLYLTDEPIGAPRRSPIVPLSFISSNGFAAFTADGNSGPTHANFSLAIEQGELGLMADDATPIDCIIYGPQVTDVSKGRCPDGALTVKTLATPTPGAPNACPFTPPPPVSVTLLRMNDVWSYDASGNDLGTAWRGTNYDDSAWAQGRGVLGFDNGNNPLVQSLTNTVLPLTNMSGQMIITYYFRTHFQYPIGTMATSLVFTNLMDDGVIVYLNDRELYRLNMPNGPVTASTQAFANAESTSFTEVTLPITNNVLQPGDNLLAVELHQFGSAPDLNMGLALSGLIITNSPAAAGVMLNEVLANNATLEELDGSKPDWVEIYNPSSNAVDLADMSLTDSTLTPRRWVFPTGSFLPGQGFLKVRLDPDLPASSTNTGFGLKANGGAVYLFNRPADGSALASSIIYGLQAADFSIGRVPNGSSNWVLCVPSFGGVNIAASLGDLLQLKANEWMASPASGDDWFEIFNPNAQPVNLSGLWLSDNVADRQKYRIPALSFIGIGPWGYLRFWAANGPDADFTGFNLNSTAEAVVISTTNGVRINHVSYTQQFNGVSEGMLPDGTSNKVFFPITSTPGKGNFLPLTNVVINELLSHSDPPLEDAVELYNLTGDDVDISGWYLSDSQNNPLKYRLPTNTVVPAGRYLVLYEYQFNADILADPFSFSSARGDEVYLSQATGPAALTGYRAFAEFGPAENGVSFGRYRTSIGFDFTAMSARTFGVDNPTDTNHFRLSMGLTNAYPKVGPVVINEIMYNPAGTNDALEFIEVHNILGTPVPLFDPGNPENTWRLRKGIDFNFPQGTTIPAGGYLVVVNFDPQTDPASLGIFQSVYGTGMTLLGPYSGKLDNGGEDVELRKPDAPQTQPGPDFGLVPYVVVDRVNYDDASPWPTSPDGTGAALKRITASLYGNDPVNWTGGAATPGSANSGSSASNTPPALSAIGDKTVAEGSLLTFTAMANDTDIPAQVLTFSLDSGAPSGASINPGSGLFAWTPTEAEGPGVYSITVRVTDSGSPVLSDSETISVTVNDVNTPPVLAPIGDKAGSEGSLITFTADAADSDLPVQALTYSLAAGAPAGAVINSSNGVFAWMPTEAQGPGSYPVTVRVTDNGSPNLIDSETITIMVSEANIPPVLASIGNKVVSAGQTLSFTAMGSDADVPAQTLTYSLDPGAPPGANINASSGLFTWTPDATQESSTNSVTIRVSDNGSPAMSDAETIAIVVAGAPRFISISRAAGIITLQWTSYPGKTYRVQRSADLGSWTNLGGTITASGPTTSTTDPIGGNQQRFYRALLVD